MSVFNLHKNLELGHYKKKWTHRHRKQTLGTEGERGVEEG